MVEYNAQHNQECTENQTDTDDIIKLCNSKPINFSNEMHFLQNQCLATQC